MRGLFLGADLVDVTEVQHALLTFGERYLERVYTPDEAAYSLSSPGDTARRLAVRFAAKEATIKALRASHTGVSPRSIEVVRNADGSCEIVLHGEALAVARKAGVCCLAVTLSHQGDFALAVVVGERVPERAQSGAGFSRLWHSHSKKMMRHGGRRS